MSQPLTDLELLIEAIQANQGNITKACKVTGISRQTYYRLRKIHPELNNISMVDDAELVSLARQSLKRAVLADYFPAVKFVLEEDSSFIKQAKKVEDDISRSFDYSLLSTEELKQLTVLMGKASPQDQLKCISTAPNRTKINDALDNTTTIEADHTNIILPNNGRDYLDVEQKQALSKIKESIEEFEDYD